MENKEEPKMPYHVVITKNGKIEVDSHCCLIMGVFADKERTKALCAYEAPRTAIMAGALELANMVDRVKEANPEIAMLLGVEELSKTLARTRAGKKTVKGEK